MNVYITLNEFSTLFSGRPNPPPLSKGEKSVSSFPKRPFLEWKNRHTNTNTNTPTSVQLHPL
jgi:hypothetical protein